MLIGAIVQYAIVGTLTDNETKVRTSQTITYTTTYTYHAQTRNTISPIDQLFTCCLHSIVVVMYVLYRFAKTIH